MNWQDLGAAVALLFVLEGMMPFVAPGRWRQAVLVATQLDNRSLRVFGGIAIAVGLVLLYLIRS